MDELTLVRDFRSEVAAPAPDVRARAEHAWADVDAAATPRPRRESGRHHPGKGFGVRVVIALVGLGVAVSTVVVFVNRALDERIDRIPRVAVATGALQPIATGHLPQTILVMGMDATPPEAGGAPPRSDAMVLLRLRRHSAEAVWVPRDLEVDIPGYGPDRINQAISLGGPTLAVQTVSRGLGVPVNHYVELEMSAFPALVDAVGGVRLSFPESIRDEVSGIQVGPGCVALDGDEALALARTRSAEALRDGRWQLIDLNADLNRIERQQSVVRALLAAVHTEVDDHPTRVPHLIDVLLGHVKVDAGMSRRDVLGLARALLAVGDPKLDVTTLPVAPSPTDPVRSLALAAGSNTVMARLGGTLPASTLPAGSVSDSGRYDVC
jgi:LCP family protein required for cell wall assembly